MAHTCIICGSECYCLNGEVDCDSCGCDSDIPNMEHNDEEADDERIHSYDYLETWVGKEDPSIL